MQRDKIDTSVGTVIALTIVNCSAFCLRAKLWPMHMRLKFNEELIAFMQVKHKHRRKIHMIYLKTYQFNSESALYLK